MELLMSIISLITSCVSAAAKITHTDIHTHTDTHLESYSLIYFIGINGWLPERQRQDITLNRTVSYRGLRDTNLEMDLVNEFLNKEFIGGLKVTSTLTDVTIARHGALVCGVKRHLHRIHNEAAGDFGCAPSRGRPSDQSEGVIRMVSSTSLKSFSRTYPVGSSGAVRSSLTA